MVNLRLAGLPLIAVTVLAATALQPDAAHTRPAAGLCTLEPGRTLALVRVEQDTTLPLVATGLQPMSLSGVPAEADSLLATAATPMPAGRVRLLDLDSATRNALAREGVTDEQPTAFLLAAPYRADCQTIRWTDTLPFVVPGELGYVRGSLAPREHWIDGVPLIVIPDAWFYPYPRRRGLAFRVGPDAPLAPAEAMFGFEAALEVPTPAGRAGRISADSLRRRAIDWARANPAGAELEPVRTRLRRAVLGPDWAVAQRIPSRLRGTYRVELELSGERTSWFFRTHGRPSYGWEDADSLRTTLELLASPHVPGYSLVGYVAASPAALPDVAPSGSPELPLVWLATDDRPTTPNNDARRALTGELRFTLAAASEPLWDALEALVPAEQRANSPELARWNLPRGRQRAQIPLTVRLNERGGVRADTALVMDGRSLRVVLERVDTLSVPRPW